MELDPTVTEINLSISTITSGNHNLGTITQTQPGQTYTHIP